MRDLTRAALQNFWLTFSWNDLFMQISNGKVCRLGFIAWNMWYTTMQLKLKLSISFEYFSFCRCPIILLYSSFKCQVGVVFSTRTLKKGKSYNSTSDIPSYLHCEWTTQMNRGRVVKQKDIQILWSEEFSVWNDAQQLSSVRPAKRKQISELISDLKYAKHTSINDRNLCCCESKLWQTLAVDSYAWFVFKDSSFLVHCRSVSLDCPITVKPLSSGPLLSSHQSNSWNSLHISTVYLTSKVVTSIKPM